MKGDSVDNIPGLPGVGDKTAKKFLKEYGSIEGLLENVSKLKGKIKEKIEGNKELGILSKKLATIITDVPIDFETEDLKFEIKDIDKTKKLFEDLEFRRLAKSLDSIFGFEKNISDKPKLKTEIIDRNGTGQFNLFQDIRVNDISKKESVIHQFIETDISTKLFLDRLKFQKDISYHLVLDNIGIAENIIKSASFCWEKNLVYVVNDDFMNFEKILKVFFEDEKISKISNDLKSDIKVLNKKNIKINGNVFDIKLAHYLINPDISHDLISVSNNYLNFSNEKEIKDYESYKISNLVLLLNPLLESDLKKYNQLNLYKKIEIPLLYTLAQMEIEGINLDINFLKKLSEKTSKELNDISKNIYGLAGEEFNISSPNN